MHPNYDHLYIPVSIIFQISKFKPQTNIFPGNNNPFSFKPTLGWVKIFEKNSNFSGLRSRYHREQIERKLLCH